MTLGWVFFIQDIKALSLKEKVVIVIKTINSIHQRVSVRDWKRTSQSGKWYVHVCKKKILVPWVYKVLIQNNEKENVIWIKWMKPLLNGSTKRIFQWSIKYEMLNTEKNQDIKI